MLDTIWRFQWSGVGCLDHIPRRVLWRGHVHFDPGGRATQLAGVAVGDEAAQLSVLDALLDVMGWQPTCGQGVLVRFCRRSGGGNGNRVSMPQIVSCFIAFPSHHCTQTVSCTFLRFAEFMGKSFSFLYHTCIDHLFLSHLQHPCLGASRYPPGPGLSLRWGPGSSSLLQGSQFGTGWLKANPETQSLPETFGVTVDLGHSCQVFPLFG